MAALLPDRCWTVTVRQPRQQGRVAITPSLVDEETAYTELERLRAEHPELTYQLAVLQLVAG